MLKGLSKDMVVCLPKLRRGRKENVSLLHSLSKEVHIAKYKGAYGGTVVRNEAIYCETQCLIYPFYTLESSIGIPFKLGGSSQRVEVFL